jgi:hypothetical protein
VQGLRLKPKLKRRLTYPPAGYVSAGGRRCGASAVWRTRVKRRPRAERAVPKLHWQSMSWRKTQNLRSRSPHPLGTTRAPARASLASPLPHEFASNDVEYFFGPPTPVFWRRARTPKFPHFLPPWPGYRTDSISCR